MTDAAASDPRPTVLVFEHEALVAMMLEEVLANAGYRVVWVSDGRVASPALEPWSPPRAAIVDLHLANGLDGRDVLRQLRGQQPGMPCVVVTGYDPFAPRANLRGLGGPTVRVHKPFECDELLERLAGVLGPPAMPPPRRRASDRPPATAA